jgi:hypothetical protein
MYRKGKSFLTAAVLLRQRGGHEFVVLHLLCQGLEIVLKGLFLYSNYAEYKKRLKRKKGDGSTFGHDLIKLATAAVDEFKIKPLEQTLLVQLRDLNNFYSNHQLRYGTFVDIFIDARTIDAAYLEESSSRNSTCKPLYRRRFVIPSA